MNNHAGIIGNGHEGAVRGRPLLGGNIGDHPVEGGTNLRGGNIEFELVIASIIGSLGSPGVPHRIINGSLIVFHLELGIAFRHGKRGSGILLFFERLSDIALVGHELIICLGQGGLVAVLGFPQVPVGGLQLSGHISGIKPGVNSITVLFIHGVLQGFYPLFGCLDLRLDLDLLFWAGPIKLGLEFRKIALLRGQGTTFRILVLEGSYRLEPHAGSLNVGIHAVLPGVFNFGLLGGDVLLLPITTQSAFQLEVAVCLIVSGFGCAQCCPSVIDVLVHTVIQQFLIPVVAGFSALDFGNGIGFVGGCLCLAFR